MNWDSKEYGRALMNRADVVDSFSDSVRRGVYPFEKALMAAAFSAPADICLLGCAAGRETAALSRDYPGLVAVDHSLGVLGALKARGGAPAAACADAEDLPFACEAFAGIVLFNFLGAAGAGTPTGDIRRRRDSAILRECRRVLRPAGRMALWVWEEIPWKEQLREWLRPSGAPGGLRRALDALRWAAGSRKTELLRRFRIGSYRALNPGDHIVRFGLVEHHFTAPELSGLLEAAGWRILHFRKGLDWGPHGEQNPAWASRVWGVVAEKAEGAPAR